MEKYGVEELGREKVAKKKDEAVCPDCGSPLEDEAETGVAKCPKDGTKPFEKK